MPSLLSILSRTPKPTETADPNGAVTRQGRDTTGALIEYVLDAAGTVTGARVLEAAPRR